MRCVLLALALADPLKLFQEFKAKFNKKYTSEEDEQVRFELFKQTLQRIEDGNARNGAPVFGVTFTADLTPEEKPKRGRKGMGDTRFVDSAPVFETSVPKASAGVDWRKTKAVTAVKNQGQCGSCWAFSTAEEVESMYMLHVDSDYLMNFSPQQVASCVSECEGCGGGDTVTAFDYLKTQKGLASEAFWPYAQGLTPLNQCMDPSCTQACSARNLSEMEKYEFYIGPYATVKGFSYATPPCTDACEHQDLDTLAKSVSAGPVSICVNAGAWDDYTGGVLTANGCGGSGYDDLDHCVQLVGYNATASTPYWIVRNSWSLTFGLEGYIHLEFGKNTCGLADEATIAELEKKPVNEAKYRELLAQATAEAPVREPVVV